MTKLPQQLFGVVPGAICVGAAGWMAVHGIDGWGWFLIAALFMVC